MKFNKKQFLYCSECKRPVEKASRMLFVEDNSLRGFCCDACIVSFYTPLMESFEADLLEKRSECQIGLEDELDSYTQNEEMFEKTLYTPDQTFELKNEIGQTFYVHKRKFNLDIGSLYFILVCLHYEKEVSFVALRLVTKSEKLAKLYEFEVAPAKLEESFQEESELTTTQDVNLPEEVMETLEFKKSQALANLIQMNYEDDFSFEEYNRFESYMPQTLQAPDEIYLTRDNEDDDIYTYIKSFKDGSRAFFYIVMCMKVRIDEKDKVADAFLPILAFPSKVADVYRHYARGDMIKGNIKN